jgi:hypothetical protein
LVLGSLAHNVRIVYRIDRQIYRRLKLDAQ